VVREPQLVLVLLAEPQAILFRLRQACQEVVAQTTIPWSLAPKFCLELFSLDGTQSVEHQLDDAVVLKRGQRDQLGSCGDNNPKSGVLKEVHHGYGFFYECSCTR
jgi:hypothetical protein